MNQKKTKVMISCSKHRYKNLNFDNITQIEVRGNKLEFVTNYDYLGVCIDSNMAFKSCLKRLAIFFIVCMHGLFLWESK